MRFSPGVLLRRRFSAHPTCSPNHGGAPSLRALAALARYLTALPVVIIFSREQENGPPAEHGEIRGLGGGDGGNGGGGIGGLRATQKASPGPPADPRRRGRRRRARRSRMKISFRIALHWRYK